MTVSRTLPAVVMMAVLMTVAACNEPTHVAALDEQDCRLSVQGPSVVADIDLRRVVSIQWPNAHHNLVELSLGGRSGRYTANMTSSDRLALIIAWHACRERET